MQLTIEALGGMADGIAQLNGKRVFVPFTCAGDVVEAELLHETKDAISARKLAIVTPSPHRKPAVCRHFETCGGCSLQHLDDEAYAHFKQRQLESFVEGMGIDNACIAPMIAVGAASRRRAEFKIACSGDTIEIGFHAAASHHLVDVQECPAVEPQLLAVLPVLRDAVASLKKPARLNAVSITSLAAGLDMLLKINAPIGREDMQTLVDVAKRNGVIRLSVALQQAHGRRGQTRIEAPRCLYGDSAATENFSDVQVALPVGAFLQATKAGQDAITQQVCMHLSGCTHIADLYSGCGTYSFALIRQSERVSAYEGASEMAAAMNDACVRAGISDRIQTTMRDLFTNPLSAQELKPFDGVVINPPRNGALPQMKQLAQSALKKVVMVSCDAPTFKRDARHLLENGFQMVHAVAIDQFVWSRHIELVASFERIGK